MVTSTPKSMLYYPNPFPVWTSLNFSVVVMMTRITSEKIIELEPDAHTPVIYDWVQRVRNCLQQVFKYVKLWP
jgi:hypothetical protein